MPIEIDLTNNDAKDKKEEMVQRVPKVENTEEASKIQDAVRKHVSSACKNHDLSIAENEDALNEFTNMVLEAMMQYAEVELNDKEKINALFSNITSEVVHPFVLDIYDSGVDAFIDEFFNLNDAKLRDDD